MKRKLEPKICSNPNCKACFVPSRKNKTFCSTKCQSTFSNSLSDEERKDRALDKAVKKNDFILGTIFRDCNFLNGDLRNISIEILNLRKFKPDFYRRTEEIKGAKSIYWMDVLGLQFLDKKKQTFTLRTRWAKYRSGN